jgi:hypothetical protein
MTLPTKLTDLTNVIYLNHRNEPVAYFRAQAKLDDRGCLPITVLNDIALWLRDNDYARFSIGTGFFSHFSYHGHQEYLLLDDAGTVFIVQAKPCGSDWAIGLPSGRWLYSANEIRAAA